VGSVSNETYNIISSLLKKPLRVHGGSILVSGNRERLETDSTMRLDSISATTLCVAAFVPFCHILDEPSFFNDLSFC
jgi:hypothetical protein